MKYARAAWWIFLAWSARKLHLPTPLVHDLEDEASMAMFGCSLDFTPAQVITAPRVVGYRCEHVSVSASAGSITAATSGCGCKLDPMYQQ